MKNHHLNCGMISPARKAARRRSRHARAERPTYLSLPARRDGNNLVLVDTGLGLRDIGTPRARLGLTFQAVLIPELAKQQTAVRQVQALGLSPRRQQYCAHAPRPGLCRPSGITFPMRMHIQAAEADTIRPPASIKAQVGFRGHTDLIEQRGYLWTEYSA